MIRTYWHLTEDPDWELDPDFHPRWAYWATGGPTRDPGLFVTEHPIYWQPYFGRGPIFVARLEIPEEAVPIPPADHPEHLITDLDQVKVVEVVPLQEAIIRGIQEEASGVPWNQAVYSRAPFGGVVDWWYARRRVWDDEKMELVTLLRPRRGLEFLMEEWRRQHPPYKSPLDRERRK